MRTAAKAFPNTSFAIVDVDQATLKGKPKNVRGLLFREQEVGYLAGYLGALIGGRGAYRVGGSTAVIQMPATVQAVLAGNNSNNLDLKYLSADTKVASPAG